MAAVKSAQATIWRQIAPYAFVSLCAFLAFLLLLAILMRNAETLVSLGLTGNFYYMVLVPLGLSAAAFLFGVLHSYALYRGEQLNGRLKLGGPVVLFIILLILGFWLPKPASNFPLTVYVHGPGGRQDMVVRGVGYVIVDLAGFRRKAQIGNDGEALFPEIPASFWGQEVPIALDVDGYEMMDSNQRARLSGSSIYVGVRKKSGHIRGYVHDSKWNPLPAVTVVARGLSVSTDQTGYFDLVVPGEELQPSLTLEAIMPGFLVWSDTVVPNSNDVLITLRR